MKGRKRHLLVDTLGLILAVVVLPANIQDWDGAYDLLLKAQPLTGRVQHMWADSSYRALVGWVEATFGWSVEIVAKLANQVGFAVQPKRWIVERTFAWLGKYRRLSKDYEEQPDSSEAWIYAAMSHTLLRRLACVPQDTG